jgi:hypothetical protein
MEVALKLNLIQGCTHNSTLPQWKLMSHDAPPNSLIDSTVSPNVKILEG